MIFRCSLAACAFLVWLSPSFAQGPQGTTATFDDWTVSCATGVEGQNSCEMVQIQTAPGQPNPVAQITIRRPAKNESFKIFFQVPTNVWLQPGMNFVLDSNSTALVATFRWCVQTRCLADADLNEENVKKLGARTDTGRADYKDAGQHNVSLPVSFKGFKPALDWMENSSR
jgi:invasion protein IalB